MSDLRAALDDLRDEIEALPSSATASQIGPLENKARELLTQSKNTSFEQEARELFSQLARLSAPGGSSPESNQVRGLLRRARIRIEIAGDDQDFDEAIDILAQALDLDPENTETHELLLQAAQRSSQHAVKVQGLAERYDLDLSAKESPTQAPPSPVMDTPAASSRNEAPPAAPATSARGENGDLDNLLSEIASTYYAGDYARTVDLATQFLAQDPDNVQAQEYRQKSEDNLMRGVVPDHRIPFDARVAYNRANSLVRAGNYEEAERLYREARDIAERAGIQSWKDVEQALLEIQDLALARELLADGDRLLAADDWSGALGKYEGALRVVPNDPEAEERLALVRKAQEQYDQASVRLSMISGTLTERAAGLVELLNMLSTLRQILPGSERLQQMYHEVGNRIQNVKTQLLEQGEGVLDRVESIAATEEKFKQAEEARAYFEAAVELDPADGRAATGLRRANQISTELNEGRQVMERAAALIAQNFDNELAQARQMLANLRHMAQDPRYQTLVSDLLTRHLERVEMALDRKDADEATRWLNISKEDPFRILGRRSEILRLENDIRAVQQRRIIKRLAALGGFVVLLAIVAFLTWDSTIGAMFFPTDTPTATASVTYTASATGTATNTATATATATDTPLPPDELTATGDAIATIDARTQAAIAAQTSTAEQIQAEIEEQQRSADLTATRDEARRIGTNTAVARTQQASATNLFQTEQAQATTNYNNTQTATLRPPSPTPSLTLTLTPSPSPTEAEQICRIVNTSTNNVFVRSLPSQDGEDIDLLAPGEPVDVYDQRRGLDDPDIVWYQIRIESGDEALVQGWVSSEVVVEIVDCPPLPDEE
ncbi:MAG: SH3 domain-containing protein [Chloroflexi bacterium]|nr:SH3 domain-containing protein [Chloroflexota bacterium]